MEFTVKMSQYIVRCIQFSILYRDSGIFLISFIKEYQHFSFKILSKICEWVRRAWPIGGKNIYYASERSPFLDGFFKKKSMFLICCPLYGPIGTVTAEWRFD